MSKPGTGTYFCPAGVKTFLFGLTAVPAGYDIYLRDENGAPIEASVEAQICRAWPPFYQDDTFTSTYHFVSALDPGLTVFLTPKSRSVYAVVV